MTLSRGITLFNLVILALIAYLCVGIFYQFAGAQIIPEDDVPASSKKAAPSTSTSTQTQQALNYYRPVLDRDLFDTAKIPQPVPKAEELNLEDMEDTELDLKLWGTVSGIDERAYAVIEDIKKREQNLYRTGDTIQNATVKKIMRAKVVLNRDGKDEILAMEKMEQGSGQSSIRGYPQPSRPPTSASRTPIRRTQRVSLRREMINESMEDISKLMTQIAVRPHMEDGQAAGLALSNIKPNSIFRRMGLRNGDILKGIDGQDIQSVDDALKLYQNLKDADSVEVQLQRRGQDRTINYNIR